MVDVVNPPCDNDPEEGKWRRSHQLDVQVNASGHPSWIVCSCGREFRVEMIEES